MLGLGAIALSTTGSWKTFQSTYNVKDGSNIHSQSCLNCHIGKKGGKLNAYGKELQALCKEAGTKKVTAAMLAKVEKLDAAGDGKTNISRINADKNPAGN